jgi:hypothetical protein
MDDNAMSRSIPIKLREKYEVIIALLNDFCDKYLDEEYNQLCQNMAATLCRKRPSPIERGKTQVWACGIIYALGQLNFLSDKSIQPFMLLADVCKHFGVGASTASAKAKDISRLLKIDLFNPTWILPSLFEHTPMGMLANLSNLFSIVDE